MAAKALLLEVAKVTFVEGMYNLLLSIESIPEVIVRKRFGIKPKSRKIDITE